MNLKEKINATETIFHSGLLDRMALEQAFGDLIIRYELSLSSASRSSGSGSIFKIRAPYCFFEDLSLQSPGYQQQFIADLSTKESRHSFDESNEDSVRLTTIKLNESEYCLVLAASPLHPDNGSLHVLIEELNSHYTSYRKTGYPDLLPGLPPFTQLNTCQDLIGQVALRYPDKTALRFNDSSFTYREIVGLANQLANLILKLNKLGPGDIVALAIDRSPEMLIALLAIMRSGACYLPIDPEYPRDRIEFMLKDSSAKILLTSRKYSNRFLAGSLDMYIEDCWENLSVYSKEDPNTVVLDDSLAYTLYTSGSTGKPKGVQVEHHSLLNLLLSMQALIGIEPQDRLLALTTISFDIAGLELYLPLITGAELILADTETGRDAGLLMDIVRKEAISIMQATPSTWKMLLEAGWDEPFPSKILCGGEALQKNLAERLMARGRTVWNLYGPTETTIWSTIKQLNTNDEIITIGRPIANTKVYILDKNLELLPDGASGEIHIAGAGVARGYLNRPDLTAERFIDNPFSTGGGDKIYRTGDLGKFLANGEIQFQGRLDHQVKIRGRRIEPGEIEHVLLRQKDIKEAMVIERNEQLIAYLVLAIPTTSSNPSWELLQRWKQDLREQLPEYMVPDQFLVLEKFPLTPNGKIDRGALPEAGKERKRNKAFIPPGTDTEKLVAAIWTECLGIENLGLYDDFFEVGGNSINALRIMTRLEKETGKRLPLTSLFKAPTVEKLALLLTRDNNSISWDTLVCIKPGAHKTPIYIVPGHGMNVLTFNSIAKYMGPGQPIYGFQPKGLNGIDEPADSIEAIAAGYVAGMLKNTPAGGYCLAGYSYGGIVAYEMARQLKVMGKQIYMLAIIDTYANNPLDLGGGARILRKILRQFRKLLFVSKGLKRNPRQTLQYQWEFFVRRGEELAGLFSNSPRQLTPEDKVDAKYLLAYHTYRLGLYDGNIDLFRVNARLYYLDDQEYLGWKPYAQQGVVIHEVSGDHKTFLLPPNDKGFAETLQRVLEERLSRIT